MDATTIDITQLTPGQLAAFISQLKVLDRANKDAQAEFVLEAAGRALDTFPTDTFESGAEGIYIHAKSDVTLASGEIRNVTVTLNVRYTETIPARKPKV